MILCIIKKEAMKTISQIPLNQSCHVFYQSKCNFHVLVKSDIINFRYCWGNKRQNQQWPTQFWKGTIIELFGPNLVSFHMVTEKKNFQISNFSTN
jgi:hypothetical protein